MAGKPDREVLRQVTGLQCECYKEVFSSCFRSEEDGVGNWWAGGGYLVQAVCGQQMWAVGFGHGPSAGDAEPVNPTMMLRFYSLRAR